MINKKKSYKIEATIDNNFLLIGISSSENDFKLCWLINQEFEIEFKRDDDLQFYNEKLNIEQNFALYSFSNDEYQAYLISNKSNSGILISEYKSIDFFIKIKTSDNSIFDFFQSKLLQIKQIQAIFKIDVNVLKLKQKLIFEI
jgi:hypothetical protein